MEEENIVQRKRLSKNENFDFSSLSTARLPLLSKNLNIKKKRKKAIKIQGKDQYPNREKNTTTSLPLIKPEPITVPIIAKNEAKKFNINIIY